MTASSLFSSQNITYSGYIFAGLGVVVAIFGNVKSGLVLLALGIIIVAVNR